MSNIELNFFAVRLCWTPQGGAHDTLPNLIKLFPLPLLHLATLTTASDTM